MSAFVPDLIVSFGLPRSPGMAIVLLVVLLTLTYIFAVALIKTGVPAQEDESEPDGPFTANVGPDDAELASYLDAQAQAEPQPEAGANDGQVLVEAIRVDGLPLAVGDTASRAMQAFRRSAADGTPEVERNERGRAARVHRAYRVGQTSVALDFRRPDPDGPLRLSSIELDGPHH